MQLNDMDSQENADTVARWPVNALSYELDAKISRAQHGLSANMQCLVAAIARTSALTNRKYGEAMGVSLRRVLFVQASAFALPPRL